MALCLSLFIAPMMAIGDQQNKPLSQDQTMFVLDANSFGVLPKHFRTSSSPFKKELASPPSREGLNALPISGSAQFSDKNLEEALKIISTRPVWIVDLRRESHGFVNGLPVSWYAQGNQSNLGLSASQILKKEKEQLKEQTQSGIIEPHKIIDKASGVIIESKPVEMKVQKTETEEELAKRLNINYIRIPVSDHHRPLDEEVDHFISFVKTLPPNAWLYFHCRGGKGRTTTFMAMYDMLQNGKKLPLDVILNREMLLGGVSLQDISDDPEDAWKQHAAIKRKDFISTFYDYATSPKGYPNTTWQEWLKTQAK